ncbi:unnamed protein product [Coffea canephora]|uniref:Protein kinase domain-containing protein n=1 Tax=Coffea canephora TaxID=49390 RepID=A0A068UUD2_COFCA|nr:unnamed protein product [Coffea canephora]
MPRSCDNWERLVTATLRREDLRLTALRTPSELSLASLSSFSSFNLASSSRRVSSFNFSSLLVGDSLSYNQILQATDYLSENKLIKHGYSGDLFFGVLEGGTPVIVKKIDLSSVTKESLFIEELEILAKVSHHHRFVPPIGHCLENEEEKFLVYKNMAKKDLSTSLSRKIDSGNLRKLPLLDWVTRLKIATEVAEGLRYLHQCVPPLVHSNIQASSILLDDKFEVTLSLYEVFAEENHMRQNGISRAFGQSATGTSNESYASCSYDVYSFGKVLLELVTGKLGLSATDDSTTNGWIANLLSYILPDNSELIINIVDSSLDMARHVLAHVWAVSFIAKACLSPESAKRPQMPQILLALEHIKSSSFTSKCPKTTGDHDSLRAAMEIAEILWGSKLVGRTAHATAYTESLGSGIASTNHKFSQAGGFEKTHPNGGIFAHPSLTIFSYSELRTATRHFGCDIAVTEVEFGRVYQAWLQDKSSSKHGNGSVVAVRNMSSEYMQLFKSRVLSLGRLSHPNIVKFLGYCEDKDLLVVHEFMQSGCLDNHLFRAGSDVQPLSWDTRLNILTGAARGLAFLHATQKQGFYEYFGTSDILLDGAFNAKISGFGTAKIILPIDEVHPNFFRNGRYVDAPPENVIPAAGLMNMETGLMNVESDVYGFGVVLVALLTGLSTNGRNQPSWGEIYPIPYFMNLKRNRLVKIMDPKLEGKYPFKAARKLGSLASMCLQYEPQFRPSMKVVVEVLERVAAAKWKDKSPG